MSFNPFTRVSNLNSPNTNSFLHTLGLSNLFYTKTQVDSAIAAAGGGGSATLDYVLVSTLANLRTAITNATNNTTIALMPGTYTLTGGPLEIQGKTGLTIRAGGNATITTDTYTENLVIRGNVTDLTLSGIRFTNTKTGVDGYGTILVNEQGPVTNLTIESCYFSNSAGGRNAITMSANSGNTTASFKGITIKQCRFINIGRMGIEILNHAWDNPGTAPQTYSRGIHISNNYFENLGVNDLQHGMAVSVSGLNEIIEIVNNTTIEGKFACYELVGGRLADISHNKAFGSTNTAVGVSISNGNGKGSTTRVTMASNNFDVKGRAFQVYDATWITITGGTYFSSLFNDLRSNLVTLNGANIKVTNDTNALYMEHAKYCQITNNIMSTTGASVQTYGVINCFYNSSDANDTRNSTDNVITGNKLFRPANAAQTIIEGSTTLNVIKENT